MKKLIRFFMPLALFCVLICTSLCACGDGIDYFSFVSEERKDIYLYEDDAVSFKIHVSLRETPYVSDGIKSQTTPIVEFFFTPDKNYNEVTVSAGSFGGEMNYLSVSNSYYLSFTGDGFKERAVKVKLTLDGQEKTFTAESVAYDGLIGGRTALKCAVEYDGELFKSLTQKRNFNGEIYVRLIYDGGCYYYVGVCDRDKNITAYLIDGENGRVIASKKN